MKVLFDHQIFTSQRFGGISRYFVNLNNGLNNTPGTCGKIAALYSENEYIKKEDLVLNKVLGRKIFNKHQNRLKRWNQRYSAFKIKRNDFDIFHPTYYDTYFVDSVNKPFVLTVHDMIHELMPHLFSDSAEMIERKNILINKAQAIIAISHHTKSDLVKFYPQAEPKITVVHHGYTYNNVQASVSKLSLPNEYILFVGDRGRYKSFIPFVTAIAGLFKQNNMLNLICAGGGNFTGAEAQTLTQLGIIKQCLQINATEAQLNQLYKQAVLFVFPSSQEGFGLPILEAFANNCPVVCSNTTSLPEVAGDAALYFNPADKLTITLAVEKLLYNDKLKQEFRIKGQERLRLFTMDQCVNNTLKVYQSLIL